MTDYQQAFVDKALPYARTAGQALGLPASVVLAQWAIESDWGRSRLASVHNNLGGISYTGHSDYRPADYSKPPSEGGGGYSGYTSLERFAADYVRVLSWTGYDAVREAAKTGDRAKVLDALIASPYATGHYSGGSGLKAIASLLAGLDAAQVPQVPQVQKSGPGYTFQASGRTGTITTVEPLTVAAWSIFALAVALALGGLVAIGEAATKEVTS